MIDPDVAATYRVSPPMLLLPKPLVRKLVDRSAITADVFLRIQTFALFLLVI